MSSRVENRRVIVTYDLAGDTEGKLCHVEVYVGNSNFQQQKLLGARGDLGADIRPGKNKQIIVSDLTPLMPFKDDLSFRIEATYQPELTAASTVDESKAGTDADRSSLGTYSVLINSYPKRSSLAINGKSYKNKSTITLTERQFDVKIKRAGYRTYSSLLVSKEGQDPEEFNILLEPIAYRQKRKALIYSFLMPGLGQYYLRRGGYYPLMGLATYGFAAISYQQYDLAQKTHDSYLQSRDIIDREQLKQQWQDQKKQSQAFFVGAVSIWIGNMIWTAVTPDELEWVNKIKTEIKFDNVNKSGEISLLYPLGASK